MSVARERSARERSHTMIVGIGLYVLRYVSAGAADDYPFVAVRLSPNDGHGISLMSMPGGSVDGLEAPGDCLVVRAERPGALSLTVAATQANGSLDSELRLERIGAASDAPSRRPTPPTIRTVAARTEPKVSVLAHVSRRGDVVSEQGEWICGPDLPIPIEGLEIQWPDKPSGVDIRYTVAVSRSNQMRVLEGTVGQFAGTRGKATPIVGFDLALSGPGASDYELRAAALFLGAPIAAKSGSELTFMGPTGREPLVGVRVAIALVGNSREIASRTAVRKSAAKKQLGQVRVHRPALAPAPRMSWSNEADPSVEQGR
jgi:hypothetical protein